MRKENIITLNDRGNNLTFKVKEMSAMQLERWIVRALLLLAGTGLFEGVKSQNDMGTMIQRAGAEFGTKGLSMLGAVDIEKAEPLLNDLLACCWYRNDKGGEFQLTPETVDGIIEDVRTLFELRKAALQVNFDFFAPAAPSDTDQGQDGTSRAQSNRKISVR